jgi:hypothetical protein
VRRAFHALETKGESLPSVTSLGVLVARQVSGGLCFWVKMVDHSKFGRLVFGGLGDTVSDRPNFALKTPCPADQVYRALVQTGSVPDGDETVKAALLIGRFSRMVHTLGPRISRAQIDPLVTTADQGEAMALDMLVAISHNHGK